MFYNTPVTSKHVDIGDNDNDNEFFLFYIIILTLTLTLKIVYLATTDILHLNYYVQHIGNKKYYIGCAKETI